jgi:hypothetical protein
MGIGVTYKKMGFPQAQCPPTSRTATRRYGSPRRTGWLALVSVSPGGAVTRRLCRPGPTKSMAVAGELWTTICPPSSPISSIRGPLLL